MTKQGIYNGHLLAIEFDKLCLFYNAGTMLSPSLPPPTPSPLPQFSTAFGMWDSPPCTPNAYRTQGLNGGTCLCN